MKKGASALYIGILASMHPFTQIRPSVPSGFPALSQIRPSVPSGFPALSQIRPSVPSVFPALTQVRSSVPSGFPALSRIRSSVPSVFPALSQIRSSVPSGFPAGYTRSLPAKSYNSSFSSSLLNTTDTILLDCLPTNVTFSSCPSSGMQRHATLCPTGINPMSSRA